MTARELLIAIHSANVGLLDFTEDELLSVIGTSAEIWQPGHSCGSINTVFSLREASGGNKR
jgi:hypothetical protein